jgi:hypothetical protein
MMGATALLLYSPLFEENSTVTSFKEVVSVASFFGQYIVTRIYYHDNYEPSAMNCVGMLESKRSQGILSGQVAWGKCSCEYKFWTEKAGEYVFDELKEQILQDPTSGFYRSGRFGEPCTDYNFDTLVECRLANPVERIATGLFYITGVICFRRIVWKLLDMIC